MSPSLPDSADSRPVRPPPASIPGDPFPWEPDPELSEPLSEPLSLPQAPKPTPDLDELFPPDLGEGD